MNLGNLIDCLGRLDPDTKVRFDFGGLAPTTVNSYRGYYDHLALGYAEPTQEATVGRLRTTLMDADGEVFYGWKGGEYRMGRDTPVWVANAGDSTGTTIVDVRDLGYGYAVILTDYED